MGELEQHIHVTGAPGLDTILHQPLPDRAALEAELGYALQADYMLCIQHSVSTEPEKAEAQMRETLAAIQQMGRQAVIIYPNSDAGGRKMIAALEQTNDPDIHLHKTLPHRTFLALMKNCSLMLGNSSSGIIESSSFRIPVINIGIRQEGRERATNVIDVPAEREAILRAVAQADTPEFQQSLQTLQNPYGDGHTGLKIAEILATMDLNPTLLQKQITIDRVLSRERRFFG